MSKIIKIGTRDSQLAIWQAETVKNLLQERGFFAELVYIKSEGDTNLQMPLYEMGVQGIFTKALDIALLNRDVDIAVHSMKDVPTVLAKGVVAAAVLPRANNLDILVPKNNISFLNDKLNAVIATGSTRRKAQWLNRYPGHIVENLRGSVNTRLKKLNENNWDGAIFAAAGLERIDLRPANAVELDWMLPAPAQGAIMVVCREADHFCFDACQGFHDTATALCTTIERDFLRGLMGGCSTPIGAHTLIVGDAVSFRGNVLSVNGKHKKEISLKVPIPDAGNLGIVAANQILDTGGREIIDALNNERSPLNS